MIEIRFPLSGSSSDGAFKKSAESNAEALFVEFKIRNDLMIAALHLAEDMHSLLVEGDTHIVNLIEWCHILSKQIERVRLPSSSSEGEAVVHSLLDQVEQRDKKISELKDKMTELNPVVAELAIAGRRAAAPATTLAPTTPASTPATTPTILSTSTHRSRSAKAEQQQ